MGLITSHIGGLKFGMFKLRIWKQIYKSKIIVIWREIIDVGSVNEYGKMWQLVKFGGAKSWYGKLLAVLNFIGWKFKNESRFTLFWLANTAPGIFLAGSWSFLFL